MHYSLVLIGAHDGHKNEKLIRRAAEVGQTLLVEPVPWLFDKLTSRFTGLTSVQFCNCALSAEDGDVDFYALPESANDILFYGDQLGSLNPTHARQHHQRLAEKVQIIRAKSLCFDTLCKEFSITSLDTLMTDTEGYDARILALFPFRNLIPRQIIFEHKHSDGVGHIGKNFANLVILLEAFGYKTRIVDDENCLAVQRTGAHAGQLRR